jgi:4-amino-4-deoxy-L-arabinose transferase-like glycosyltransferase
MNLLFALRRQNHAAGASGLVLAVLLGAGLALVVARVVMAWIWPVPLSVDEAQYLVWSRDLQAGYYSKPPVIAWVIHLAAAVCAPEPPSFSLGCIRFLQPLAFLGAATAVGLTAWLLFRSGAAALWSGLLFLTLPLSSFYSQAATTDAWLLLFWALALFAFVYADQNRERLLPWLVCGLLCGLGFLAKYSMALFGVGALIWVVWQRRLLSLGPWLALAVATLVALPNGLWNAQWGWPTLAHHAEITVGQSAGGGLAAALGFFASQFLVMGPLTFLFFLIASLPKRALLVQNARAMHLLACFAWPVLVVVLAQAFGSRAHANWAAPASMGIVLMAVGYWHTRLQGRVGSFGLFASLGLHSLFAVLLLSLPWLVPALGMSGQRASDPLYRLTGYTELALQVHALPEARLVLARDRDLLAHLDAQLVDRKVFTYASAAKPAHHWQLQKDIDKQRHLITDEDWPALLLFRGETAPELGMFLKVQPVDQTHPQWAQALAQVVVAGRPSAPVSALWVWPAAAAGPSR